MHVNKRGQKTLERPAFHAWIDESDANFHQQTAAHDLLYTELVAMQRTGNWMIAGHHHPSTIIGTTSESSAVCRIVHDLVSDHIQMSEEAQIRNVDS